VEFFLGYYQPSKELTAILEEKSGKTTNGITNKIMCPEDNIPLIYSYFTYTIIGNYIVKKKPQKPFIMHPAL
jgi:hypothetical protein